MGTLTGFQIACLLLGVFSAAGVVMGLWMLSAYLRDADEFDARLEALDAELDAMQARFEERERAKKTDFFA